MSDKNDLRLTNPWDPEDNPTREDWDSPENQRIQNENFPKDASVFVGAVEHPIVRTHITFWKDGMRFYEITTEHTIPNVLAGQIFAGEHPQLAKCLRGRVVNVQHAIRLLDDDKPPITYIDVQVHPF